MADLPLIAPLSGGDYDRADALRRDPEAVAALLAGAPARLLPFWRGKPAVRVAEGAPPVLALQRLGEALRAADPEPVFIGFDRAAGEGAARFAVDLSELEEEAALALLDSGEAARFIDLRGVGADLSPSEAGAVAVSRSLLEWRRAHRFCARCGGPTRQALGGWRRDCADCGAPHFPRTDPVVIMLVAGRHPETGEERLALGRQPSWAAGLYSLLAGYVEPGETVEAAVRREVFEEAGITVGRVRYLASQPWPFPSSLMLGLWAEALTETIIRDPHELEDCRWFDRAELAEALAGRHPTMISPRRDAIARTLIEAWVAGTLPEAG